jgi:hypothetical protein
MAVIRAIEVTAVDLPLRRPINLGGRLKHVFVNPGERQVDGDVPIPVVAMPGNEVETCDLLRGDSYAALSPCNLVRPSLNGAPRELPCRRDRRVT